MRLPSRNLSDRDAFATEFLASTRAGVIPAASFIDWMAVESIADEIVDPESAVALLRAHILAGRPARGSLEEALRSTVDPCTLVRQLFFLLGHTGKRFVSFEYDVDIPKVSMACRRGDDEAVALLADALFDAGIAAVLRSGSLADVARGIRIGLDTHRRKSSGGAAFSVLVAEILHNAEMTLALAGHNLRVQTEVTVAYDEGLAKTVDFAVTDGDGTVAVVEINFYTAGGSKPSEVARSYSDLSRKFESRGIPFIWITDGRGWHTMRNVVKEMPLQVPNIYTTSQASEHLAADLAWLMEQRESMRRLSS